VPHHFHWRNDETPWPDAEFADESEARLLAESLRPCVATPFVLHDRYDRVIERYEPIWEANDPYLQWFSPTISGDVFWLSHPEIVSPDVATEHYFTLSTSAVSASAKHWPSAETMWTEVLARYGSDGEREGSLGSSPCRTRQQKSLPPSSSDAGGDWYLPLHLVRQFSLHTFVPG
jgi:hypothetical protein